MIPPANARPDPRSEGVHLAKLKDLFKLSRPVLFEQEDEDYPYGGQGTCFLCAYRDTLFVITAAHVFASSVPETLRILPTDHATDFIGIDRHYKLAATKAEDGAAADLTIFRVSEADVTVDDIPEAARLDRWRPPILDSETKLYAVGYPDDKREIDYAGCRIQYAPDVLEFDSPGPSSLSGHIEMSFSSAPLHTSLSGFSGSPVFTIRDDGGRASCGFAGILTRARHALGARTVVAALRKAADEG